MDKDKKDRLDKGLGIIHDPAMVKSDVYKAVQDEIDEILLEVGYVCAAKYKLIFGKEFSEEDIQKIIFYEFTQYAFIEELNRIMKDLFNYRNNKRIHEIVKEFDMVGDIAKLYKGIISKIKSKEHK